jgi:hypothetical protein
VSPAAEEFDTVIASIPHHDVFRGMWSGRVTHLSDHHLRDCPRCGRQLPVTSEVATLSAEHEFAPSGQYVPTDDELSLQCFVCGPARDRRVDVALDEFLGGARALRDRLDEQQWHAWVELFDEGLAAADDADGARIDQVKGHEERSAPLFALAIGSALHWPHRA